MVGETCSADLPFKVCGFERWVVLQGRFEAAESKSDSALHGGRSTNRKKREQILISPHNGLTHKSEAKASVEVLALHIAAKAMAEELDRVLRRTRACFTSNFRLNDFRPRQEASPLLRSTAERV
jgi:hypothetical protein